LLANVLKQNKFENFSKNVIISLLHTGTYLTNKSTRDELNSWLARRLQVVLDVSVAYTHIYSIGMRYLSMYILY